MPILIGNNYANGINQSGFNYLPDNSITYISVDEAGPA
jgi:hypothetical protein